METLRVLGLLKPALAKKEFVEQASHFLFTGADAVSFNDKICIIHPYDSELEFSVKGEEFYRILSAMTDEEVEITLTETLVKVKSSDTKAGMSKFISEDGLIGEKVQAIKEDMEDWIGLPENFVEGLFMCLFSAAKDDSMGALACIQIGGKNVLSTDRHRASHFRMSSGIENDFLLPVKAVQELVKFPITEYCITENWAHFRTDDEVTFSCKVFYKHSYKDVPDCLTFFAIKGTTLEIPVKVKDLVSDVELYAYGTTKDGKYVKLVIESGKITCKAESGGNWIEKSIDFEYKGTTLEFPVTPSFLIEVLAKSTKMTVQGKDRALFTSKDFRHAIVLPEEKEG